MTRPRFIAIDGPVAVGKSTVGRLLAKKLGYRFIDTGNMYRALTWKAIGEGLDLEDEGKLTELAQRTQMEITDQAVRVDGDEVSQQLRSPEVERGVSLVARLPGVRRALVAQQRKLARRGGVVMAGRDIGTVVLPRAQLKVFLTASARERAQRRLGELGQGDYNTILREMQRRDAIDSQRAASPLQPAPDAQILNTEGFGLEEVVERILALAGED